MGLFLPGIDDGLDVRRPSPTNGAWCPPRATGLRGERAYADTLAHDGRVLEPDVLPALAGASVARAAAQLEVPADELRRRLFGAFREERHAVLRGARELVEKLRRRSLLAVATNAPADLVQETLADVGLIDSFELIVSAETLPHREKPAPDVYIQACVELRVAPDHAIAFEDSPIGALAARRAGLVVVYVPSNGQVSDDADLRVDHLDDPRLLDFLGGL
jgi:HAD superfamily hydrolase (TIGR01509 family)